MAAPTTIRPPTHEQAKLQQDVGHRKPGDRALRSADLVGRTSKIGQMGEPGGRRERRQRKDQPGERRDDKRDDPAGNRRGNEARGVGPADAGNKDWKRGGSKEQDRQRRRFAGADRQQRCRNASQYADHEGCRSQVHVCSLSCSIKQLETVHVAWSQASVPTRDFIFSPPRPSRRRAGRRPNRRPG
jgi:hypothetical protein